MTSWVTIMDFYEGMWHFCGMA